MKKCYVVLNGEPYDLKQDLSDGYVIACDGALKYCEQYCIKVDTALGDFDSLGYVPKNAEIFPSEKDYTDGELALRFAYEKGFDSIEFLFAGGLREDHFLGNLALLEIADSFGIIARLNTKFSNIYFAKKSFKISNVLNKTISIVPTISDAFISNTKGLKYPLYNSTLLHSSTRGISNVATENDIEIQIETGAVFVFVNF